MELRGVCVLLLLLLLVDRSVQQNQPRRKPLKKEVEKQKDPAIEKLQKQIDDIVQELNLLKEQQALQAICLKGAKIQRKCYLAEPVRKSYHAASEDCSNLGGVLGSPGSSSENQQLRDYLQQSLGPGEQVWLGLSDVLKEGTWVDHSGASVTYTNWDRSSSPSPQPDGGPSQNCAVLSGSSNGKWLDENCKEEKASVCQFNIV